MEMSLFIVSKRVSCRFASCVRAGSSQFYSTFLVFNSSPRWTDRQRRGRGGGKRRETCLGYIKRHMPNTHALARPTRAQFQCKFGEGTRWQGQTRATTLQLTGRNCHPNPPLPPCALLLYNCHPSVVIIPTTSTQLASASDAESKSESDSKSGICADCDDNSWLEWVVAPLLSLPPPSSGLAVRVLCPGSKQTFMRLINDYLAHSSSIIINQLRVQQGCVCLRVEYLLVDYLCIFSLSIFISVGRASCIFVPQYPLSCYLHAERVQFVKRKRKHPRRRRRRQRSRRGWGVWFTQPSWYPFWTPIPVSDFAIACG